MAGRISNSIVTNGLVMYLDAANSKSYVSGSTVWNDLTENKNNVSLINGPTYNNSNAGKIVLDGADDYISIPFASSLNTSDFTWQSFHYYKTDNNPLQGLWWSAQGIFGGTKNFVMAYRDIGLSSVFFRIDTQNPVAYTSTNFGTQFNGFGSTAGPIVGKWVFTTIVKNGSNFKLYWNDGILMWDVNIPDWNIVTLSLPITFGIRFIPVVTSNMDISNILMYNRSLNTDQIQQNYNALKWRYGL